VALRTRNEQKEHEQEQGKDVDDHGAEERVTRKLVI
jgi:hypothetical protein